MQDYFENENIICNVSKCFYNHDKKYCTAEQIHVGPQNAENTKDTFCDTFEDEDSAY